MQIQRSSLKGEIPQTQKITESKFITYLLRVSGVSSALSSVTPRVLCPELVRCSVPCRGMRGDWVLIPPPAPPPLPCEPRSLRRVDRRLMKEELCLNLSLSLRSRKRKERDAVRRMADGEQCAPERHAVQSTEESVENMHSGCAKNKQNHGIQGELNIQREQMTGNKWSKDRVKRRNPDDRQQSIIKLKRWK